MKKNSLIFIIKSFSAKEKREFKKWLASPIHNQRTDVIALTEYFFHKNHLLDEKFLKKERVFSKIYPKEKYDDAKMRQTIHFLNKTIEDFLTYNGLKENEIRAKLALASVLRKKKLTKPYLRAIKSATELQEKSIINDEHFLRNEYLIQRERYIYFEKQKRNVELNLQEMSDALDATYFADKLRQSCLMLSHQKVYKVEYSPALIEEILTHIEEGYYFKIPAISIYYYTYMALTTPDKRQYFDQLKSNIFEKGHFFTQTEIRDIYLMAINYCIGKMNAGDISFRKEAFDLYKKGMESKILIENNTLSPWSFINIIFNALQLKEFDWAYDFINRYQSYLPAEHRENFSYYGYARYHFEKDEHDKAMEWLGGTDFSDSLLNLNAKMLLLKIYYKKKEMDALESLLESTRTYLHRKKMVGYHHSVYNNHLRMLRKLVRVNPYSKKDIQNLKKTITACNPLLEKDWLLEQLEALE